MTHVTIGLKIQFCSFIYSFFIKPSGGPTLTSLSRAEKQLCMEHGLGRVRLGWAGD